MKRRRLKSNQKVIIIYRRSIGYVQEPAVFTGYRRIMLTNSVEHEIPVFSQGNQEILGLDCFWLLEEEANSASIERIQRQLPALQIAAYEMAAELKYTMPEKVQDPQLKKIADANSARMQGIIDQLGYDPRDETWLEEMVETQREKNWFSFEKENALVLSSNWDDLTTVFNQQYKDNIDPDIAKNISKKRMRYYLGAYHLRLAGSTKQEWIAAAIDFEKKHRERENRMLTWTLLHRQHFPLVRGKKPIRFWPGPYLYEFIERVPRIFEDTTFKFIKAGVVFRVISYDKIDKYIRLDFTEDIRRKIKPDEPAAAKIWLKDVPDYDLWLKPAEVESHIEVLEPLD